MTINELLIEISGGSDKVGTLEGRMKVALSVGYMDSRTMVHLMETHGLPLSMCAMKCAEHGLKIDYSGLRCELERIGKKAATIDSELLEVKFFVDALKKQG